MKTCTSHAPGMHGLLLGTGMRHLMGKVHGELKSSARIKQAETPRNLLGNEQCFRATIYEGEHLMPGYNQSTRWMKHHMLSNAAVYWVA
jgi:hypothetical protein